MRRAGRVLLHAALLGLLVAGTVYGIGMLAGYVVMVLGAASGRMPMADRTVTEWAFGVLMVVSWGGVIVAGLASLWRQWRRGVTLARWVDASGGAASPKLAKRLRRMRSFRSAARGSRLGGVRVHPRSLAPSRRRE